jgi:NitT/TauT family transport system substrate-binding protein
MLFLAGCAPAAPAAQNLHLRVGLLPILDVIPFMIADQGGFYADQGMQVELIPVKSAQERDTLMQTGQIDCQLNDLISTGLFNKDAARIKIVYTARRSYPTAPQFRILAGPKSTITDVKALKGTAIAVSQNTVIEYVTARLLQAQGLSPADIKVQEVTAIPVRFEQLLNGNIAAATLPDPLGQGAIAAGARLLMDDANYPQYSLSVVSCSTDVIKKQPEAVRRLLASWEKSVKDLNANPAKYQDLLVQQGKVPQSIQGSYKMPPFPDKGVPSEAEIADALAWMKDKGLVSRNVPYGDMVDASFLPK